MRIAIIGASGYIGSYLYKQLSEDPNRYEVVGYDIDQRWPWIIPCRARDIPTGILSSYDVVIYLCGLTSRGSCAACPYSQVIEENITEFLMCAERLEPHQLLLYASSAGVLEGYWSSPAREDCPVRTGSLDTYTLSMYLRELSIRAMSVRSIGLRFGTVIGISPNQRTDLLHMAMLRSALGDGAIRVQNPACHRAILSLSDLYGAVVAILTKPGFAGGHRVYNLASHNTTVGEAAQIVAAQYNVPIHIECDHGPSGFQMDCTTFVRDYGDGILSQTPADILRELRENCGHLGGNVRSCRVCKRSGLATVIDLGYQPLANSYTSSPVKQQGYPLCLQRCSVCHHTQLNYTVPPSVMFSDYQYVSGTSHTLRAYFGALARKVIDDTGIAHGRVLELACNDGSQLSEFARLGWETWGVDPARNLSTVAIADGHQIRVGFWGVDVFPDIPTPDVIVAQNVLAHVPDPVAFLRACAAVMSCKTTLYIQTSQCDMYRNGEFDTIYHEHLSFFTISSMMHAAEGTGLGITEITKQPIHGTSYLFRMAVGAPHSEQAIAMFEEERAFGLYDDIFYRGYSMRIQDMKRWMLRVIARYRDDGYAIIGYGAAAKGMTMINYLGIDGIDYIVDDAPMKHGRYTPGGMIPIVHPDRMAEDARRICIVVFAWNFLDEIFAKTSLLRGGKNTHMVVPFPTQHIRIVYDDTIE